MTTTLLPETHYSVGLATALQADESRWSLEIYADDASGNLQVPLRRIQLVWRRSFRFLRDILGAVGRRPPAVMHLQHEINMYGGKACAPLFPLLVRALRRRGMPTVVTVHGVASKASLNEMFGKTFLPPALRLPLVMRLTAPVLAWIFRAICRDADCVIVHAEVLGRHLVEDYGADAAKLHVIPIGVANTPLVPEDRRPRAAWADRCDGTSFLTCFGYVARRKGIELLFEAYARLDPATRPPLVLAGAARDPKYLEELMTLAEQLRIAEDVIVTGLLSISDIDWLLRRAMVALFSYRFSISASGPLAIAFGYGVPAIAPASGVFNDDLEHEVDALLYTPGDAGAYAEAISRLVAEPALRDRLSAGSAAKGRVRDWAVVAARTRDVYDLAARAGSGRA